MNKRLYTFLALALAAMPLWACDVCERQQPKILRGISHGTGPQHAWDMPIIAISAAVVLLTLVLAVKYLVWPKEQSQTHIKRVILQNTLQDHGR